MGERRNTRTVENVKKQILSEIFDLIGQEVNLSSEEVGIIISKWIEYFNFWFDRKCLHCGKILTPDTIDTLISYKAYVGYNLMLRGE